MLSDEATKGSTYVIDATFTDEDTNPVTPNASVVWELFEGTTKISEGSKAPTATTSLVIKGDDLQPSGAGPVTLDVVVSTFYSSALGSSLPLIIADQFVCNDAYP